LIGILHGNTKNQKLLRRVIPSISLLVRVAPINSLGPILLQTGVFAHITEALEDDEASGLVLAAYLDVLARIILADANTFLHMVAESARAKGVDGHKALEQVLDAFWRNFDYVGEARTRKAIAMAAGALLTTVSLTVIHLDATLIFQGNRECLERLDGEFSQLPAPALPYAPS
jgi:hypothetical protein